nr:helix-turn-helix domain-containing protein [Phenylobacterium sp. SCN 70-31]
MEPSRQLDRRAWLGLGSAALVGWGASARLRGRGRPPQRLDETPVLRQVLDDPGSPRIGPAAADVTVVVFTGYQCPICRRNRVVGRNVRRLRLARKLTQEDLAGEAGLAMRHLGRIERGTSSPTVAILARLAEAMGVTPADFLAVEDLPKSGQ